MKKNDTYSVLVMAGLAFLSACSTPQNDIAPATATSQTTVTPQSPVTAKQGLVVQITEFSILANGEKTVKLNGKDLSVSWRLRNEYAYDAQSRLISQKTKGQNNANWWEELSYTYTPDLVQRYQNSENKDLLNTLLLNMKGYLKGNSAPDEYGYDADGYLVSYKGNGQQDTYTIKNGNVIAKETVYSSGAVQKSVYEYDLTKLSIPSPLTFRGKQSQNLVTKQTMVTTSATTGVSQTSVFTYQYDFDTQGRAVREFVVSATDPNWPSSIREFVYQ
ncbi:hypothetical protein [Spirosoma agri]|uniref:DUF4595 domain-containing protein n=1 Tax=Spirosoma agri TaxID=1987381 RepID=A0A6M0IIK5_9BACT|nr:hypothetical protein [Spirosoma agri]NEU68116.1 hypothetical protein [Spirosoma agri]